MLKFGVIHVRYYYNGHLLDLCLPSSDSSAVTAQCGDFANKFSTHFFYNINNNKLVFIDTTSYILQLVLQIQIG